MDPNFIPFFQTRIQEPRWSLLTTIWTRLKRLLPASEIELCVLIKASALWKEVGEKVVEVMEEKERWCWYSSGVGIEDRGRRKNVDGKPRAMEDLSVRSNMCCLNKVWMTRCRIPDVDEGNCQSWGWRRSLVKGSKMPAYWCGIMSRQSICFPPFLFLLPRLITSSTLLSSFSISYPIPVHLTLNVRSKLHFHNAAQISIFNLRKLSELYVEEVHPGSDRTSPSVVHYQVPRHKPDF